MLFSACVYIKKLSSSGLPAGRQARLGDPIPLEDNGFPIKNFGNDEHEMIVYSQTLSIFVVTLKSSSEECIEMLF